MPLQKRLMNEARIIGKHQSWDQLIDYDSAKYKTNYTFNADLEGFIKKQLALYRPDFTSVVVLDNETGHILAAVDYARAKNVFGRDLAFTTTHHLPVFLKSLRLLIF